MPDKAILLHNGAVGDFFMAWPAAWTISRWARKTPLIWGGSMERMPWLAPLGYAPCDARLRKALDGLHGATRWPETLAGWTLFWLVLRKLPDVPSHGQLFFLRALPQRPGTSTQHTYGGQKHGLARECPSAGSPVFSGSNLPLETIPAPRGANAAPFHVRGAWLSRLEACGIAVPNGWREDFRKLFAAQRSPGKSVLLFPGAGHPFKQWPLVQFFQLADLIAAKGLAPLFVLGPAEMERGLVPHGRAWVAPASLTELQTLLLTARAVVGPDTGPMHLAGMLGIPGVCLFGPTDPALWGPLHVRHLRLGLPCSPCSSDCTDIDCTAHRCLTTLSPQKALEELEKCLEETKTGFQGPGFLESRFYQKEEG